METRARSCYSESTDRLQSNQFVQMMVLDGCFIIELFFKCKEVIEEEEIKGKEVKIKGKEVKIKGKEVIEEEEILLRKKEADEDPIRGTNWMFPLVAQDMLLLENQLPFVVLQSLFKLVHKSNTHTLVQLALKFFDHLLPRDNRSDPKNYDPEKFCHLLHLFHSALLPVDNEEGELNRFSCCAQVPFWDKRPPAPSKWIPKSIPSATELKEAGVKFKQKKKMARGSFLEVDFSKGVMEIAHLSIYDSTNSLFRNSIAFEQCFPISGDHFTSYAILMDCLINTPNDVAILKQNKIIEHMLGRDEEVALLFNQLGKGVGVDFENCYFSSLFKDVNKYCESKWHIWRATLVRRYFRNPWTIISLVAAILILTLTFTQTFFSVFSYARPP